MHLPDPRPSPAAIPNASRDASRNASVNPLIADRGECVDALHELLRGHIVVRLGDHAWGCQLNGAPLRHSFGTLLQFGLIAPAE